MDLRLIWFENESIYHINHQIKLGNALLESLSEQSRLKPKKDTQIDLRRFLIMLRYRGPQQKKD